MYPLLATGIIILATVENLWPSVVGFLSTPKGFVFLGTVHHPGDYFYYLSQFTQGGSRFISAIDLYTAEAIPPSFVGWSNVLMGRVFHMLGYPPIFAYQLSLALLTVCALLAIAVLCRTILQKPLATITAFFLFNLFHAFPVMRDGVSSYGDYWNNYAVPRVRLGGVPHQLITATVSVLIVYFVIRILGKPKASRKMLIGLALTSFVLASLQPVLWALIILSVILTVLVYRAPEKKNMFLAVKNAAPAASVLLFSGLTPALYLTRLFESLPFSQLKIWEATQQTQFTSEHFLAATGPMLFVALFSLPAALSRRTFSHYFIVIFTTISFLIFLSPVPVFFGITHVRFMSTLAILGLSILGGHGIHSLLITPSGWAKTFGIFTLFILSVVTLPNHIKTLRLVSIFTPTNTYQYLPKNDYALLRQAGSVSQATDIFLVAAPYDIIFPALSGRKTYYGHPLLTVNAAKKQALSQAFFSASMDPAARYDFVRDNSISWIIMPKTHQKSITARWMKLIAESDTLLLYRVLK